MKTKLILFFTLILTPLSSCDQSNSKTKTFETLGGKFIDHKEIDNFILRTMDSLSLP